MTWLADCIGQTWLYWGVPVALLALIAWVYRPSARQRYKADGKIPFEEDRPR